MIAGNSIFQWNVAKYFALLFVWSAHVLLDVQRSFQLPNWRFFPQPLQPRHPLTLTEGFQPLKLQGLKPHTLPTTYVGAKAPTHKSKAPLVTQLSTEDP